MPVTGTSCASVVADVQGADGASSRLLRANVTAAGDTRPSSHPEPWGQSTAASVTGLLQAAPRFVLHL